MHSITLTAAKHGQGCTTLAVGLANAYHRLGHSVAVYGDRDLPAAAGRPGEGDDPTHPAQTIYLRGDDQETIGIHDLGRIAGTEPFDSLTGRQPGAVSLLVTRPCYLALRAAVRWGWRRDGFDGILLVNEPGRALGVDDVAAVLDLPVIATIDVDPAVARLVDSGLMLDRTPRADFARACRQIREVAATRNAVTA